MARRNRTVDDRWNSLQPVPPAANFTLAGMRMAYERSGGKALSCTIRGYCRTQIFEFPGVDFHPDGDEPHHTIYESLDVRVTVASDLVGYFENSPFGKHYVISPSLRYEVGETVETISSQQPNRVPLFLVIEEANQLTPVEMVKGECYVLDEVVVQDGENVPVLIGGREGEEFIVACHTIDGAWPELPNNQLVVNMVLAAVRAGQQTPGLIRKHFDQACLVTDDDRFVVMMHFTLSSAEGSTATPMDTTAYRARLSEIQRAIATVEQDIGAPHMALLVNAMYSDERKDDADQRLQYLQLWQSLQDAARKYLNYQKKLPGNKDVVAGNRSLGELLDYRDDIAHWRTDTIDMNFLADLRRTINELMRRKYF